MLRKLEKYDIVEEIGHGGMATVYRAHDTVLDRAVALKVMHPHLRAAEEARRRFHREARSVARLRHPRVLEIYDFSGEGSSEAYIAAELLTGPTLKHWREQQQDVPAEIAACFAIEIASALEHAHAANIVHRDVKPENVLLHEDRTLKLTDFGIADMIDAQSMTATGQILGSPGHMAPEQIEGKDCDARTDLFSLGTVLYYLATGRLPFTGRNPHQVLKRIIDGEYADPLRVNPTMGGRMRAIIVKALEHDASARYQNAREMITELEAFLAEAGITDSAQLLERYLKDPEKVGAEVRTQTIDRLIENGARASDAGDVPAALDYYNRVLALDEGNERVLKLIERVGMDRRRRMMLMAGAGLMVFGAITAAGAWALWPDPNDDHDPIAATIDTRSIQDAGTDAGTAIVLVELDSGAEEPIDASTTRLASAEDAGRAPRRVIERDRPPAGPRVVRLVMNINSVSIAVGDEEPRPWASANTRELRPGRYPVRLIPETGVENLYQTTTTTLVVEPGEGEQLARLSVRPHPAVIQINSNVAGDVIIPATGDRGRTGDPIVVHLTQAPQGVRIRVEAPLHAPNEQVVTLQPNPNRTIEIPVTLRPASQAQAP